MVILTIILVQVLCVINRQNIILKYGMRGHFRYSNVYHVEGYKLCSLGVAFTKGYIQLYFAQGFNSCPSGLATPIFSLSSLESKSLRMVILTIILVQVLCCLYQSPKHYIEIWHERPFSLHK